MGLDGLELILRIEESFGIEIAEADAVRLLTVGDLEEYVAARVGMSASGGCTTRTAFFALRRSIAAHRGPAPSQVRARPETDVAALAPEEAPARRAWWSALEASTGLAFPPLERSTPVRAFIACLSAAVGITLGRQIDDLGPALVLGGFAALLAALLGLGLTRRWATCLPSDLQTVGELARHLAANHHAALARTGGWNAAEVRPAVRRIISEQLGVDSARLRPELAFVRDLGVG